MFTIIFIGINILIYFSISIISSKSAVSLSISLLVWAILVVVIPNVSWLLSRKITTVPSISNLTRLEEQRVVQQQLTKTPGWWNGNCDHSAPVQGVLDWKSKCDSRDIIHYEIWNDYKNKLFQQTNSVINCSKISPFSIFNFMSDKLSDSNFLGYANFYEQASIYQNIIKDYVRKKDLEDNDSYHLIFNDIEKSPLFMSKKAIEPSDLASFSYKSPSISKIFSDCKYDLIILLTWIIGLFTFVYSKSLKFDVIP